MKSAHPSDKHSYVTLNEIPDLIALVMLNDHAREPVKSHAPSSPPQHRKTDTPEQH
jgi:hypothetical protein